MADAKSSKTSDRKLSGAAARAVEKKLREGAKPMAQGIGESKLFGGSGAEPDLSDYTCNGLPIPREYWANFPISLTDQAKADMERERAALPVRYKGRDRTEYERIFDPDKKAQKFADDRRDEDTDGLVMIHDPLQPLIEKHTPAGHRGMFLSMKKCKEVGLIRGVLEYKPVLIDDPDNPGTRIRVECGGMFLASVPIDLAEKSDRYYRQLNDDRKVQTMDRVREQVDQVMSENKLDRFTRKRGAGDTTVGLEEEDQERGDAELLREALAHE